MSNLNQVLLARIIIFDLAQRKQTSNENLIHQALVREIREKKA